MAIVSAFTAPLDTEYGVSPRGRIDETDEMLTIAPPPLAAITGMTCLDISIMLLTLTRSTSSQNSSALSTTLPEPPMPTLLCRILMGPYCCTVCSTTRRQSASRVTSASMTKASPCSSAIIARVCSAQSATRPLSSVHARLSPDTLLCRQGAQLVCDAL